MPVCPSCGKQVLVLCADDGLCRDCSACCRGRGEAAAVRAVHG